MNLDLMEKILSRIKNLMKKLLGILVLSLLCFNSGVSMPEKRIFSPFKTMVSPSTIFRLSAKLMLQVRRPRTKIPKSFFIIESYLNILGFCRRKLIRNCYETLNKQKLSLCFLVEFNYYGYKHSLTERWLSG